MSTRKAFVLGAIVGAGVLAAALAGVGLAARKDDGGSGTYSGPGTTLTFNVANSGTTDWQYIVFVLPAGSSFVQGQVTAGGSAPCTVGSFVLGGGELECGAFSSAVPPNGKVTATATIGAAIMPCGSPVQFYVNSTGKPPYSRASDLIFSGSCGTPKDCDQERAAVAAAKAEVGAAEEVLSAAKAAEDLAYQEVKRADAKLALFQANGGSAIDAIAGSNVFSEVESAESFAHLWYGREIREHQRAGERLKGAKARLADAEKALASCEASGPSRSLAHVRRIAEHKACGTEQAALAGAQARAKELTVGVGQLEQTKLRAAENHLHTAITALMKALAKPALRSYLPKLDPVLALLRQAETILLGAVHRLDRLEKSAKAAAASVPKAKAALAKCKATPPAVSISEADTWTYNTAIGKANICINISTTPPQASISAKVTGPNNYTASLPVTPLHPDGTRQIGAPITQAGNYTDTLTVYDANGTQTATTTNIFTVAPPPQDGPTPKFGPSCPKPTQ